MWLQEYIVRLCWLKKGATHYRVAPFSLHLIPYLIRLCFASPLIAQLYQTYGQPGYSQAFTASSAVHISRPHSGGGAGG